VQNKLRQVETISDEDEKGREREPIGESETGRTDEMVERL